VYDLTVPITVLAIVFCMVAFFYASVGLGGGFSYTALLAIFGAGAATIPMQKILGSILVVAVIFLGVKVVDLYL
jgi:hypothetical protein